MGLQMRAAIMIMLAVMGLAGCASQPVVEPITMYNDWRVGTEQTPYRTIAPVLICQGCGG